MRSFVSALLVAATLGVSSVSAYAAPSKYVYFGQTEWAQAYFTVMALVSGGGGDAGCGN